eukprot:TRINITY_DN19406_c0_g1_i1.p1 TRINITY_DN19406_c0_g1~~TRINITY_DN19406_c0_g1_i1.p1  ORF type:complete len:348 (+),score=38.68 TRINITY_DN19406_c0_g1_i1:118-1044(+)
MHRSTKVMAAAMAVLVTTGMMMTEEEVNSIRKYRTEEVRTCLKQRKIVLIGDSVMYEVAGSIGDKAIRNMARFISGGSKGFAFRGDRNDTGETAGLEYYHDPMVGVPEGHEFAAIRKHPQYISALMTANVVIINPGLWDMGERSCGISAFFTQTMSRVTELRSSMPPTASLYILGLRTIHARTVCAEQTLCYECNYPRKVAAYRSVLASLPFCHPGVTGHIDISDITLTTSARTPDGIHYNGYHNVPQAEMDAVLNAACCESGPRKITISSQAGKCAFFRERLRSWASDEEVNAGCTAPNATRKGCLL